MSKEKSKGKLEIKNTIDAEELKLLVEHLREPCFYCKFELPFINSIYRSDKNKKFVIFSLCELCYNRLEEIKEELTIRLEKRAGEV